MEKKAIIDIKESASELKELLVKQTSLKAEKRMKSLIYIKSSKFDTRLELADYLGVHIRTLERWIHRYKSGGLNSMLRDKPKNKKSKIVTLEIHQGLERRVTDPHSPFLGYWDAQNWVKQEYSAYRKYARFNARW